MTDPAKQRIRNALTTLLHGNLAGWHGLPEETTVTDVVAVYERMPNGRAGRLAGHWLTYHDFPGVNALPDARIWSREGRVVRIDLDKPGFENAVDPLDRLGKPPQERLPPRGYRYDEEDELIEYLYPARGLVLHVSDPTLPGGSPTRRIVRVRAFAPMSVEQYDRDLGGQQPGRIRRPNR
jgi:hypothetical protein